MSLQEDRHDERRTGVRHIYQTAQTFSGTGGSFIANGSNGESVFSGTLEMVSTASQDFQVVYVQSASAVPSDKYQPEMVANLLWLDAQPPEAKFNNVVDMMDWLNSD